MNLFCRLGFHRYSVFPQATELIDLRRGHVWGFCERCRDARVLDLSPEKPSRS